MPLTDTMYTVCKPNGKKRSLRVYESIGPLLEAVILCTVSLFCYQHKTDYRGVGVIIDCDVPPARAAAHCVEGKCQTKEN